MDGEPITNVPWRVSGLWEVPITNFHTGAWKMRGLKPLDVGAVSFAEMKHVLLQAERMGLAAVVFLMHSFTLFKKADVQFLRLQPDHLVIRRFRRLCRFLGENSHRFKVGAFASRPEFSSTPAHLPIPDAGALLPACRKMVQGFNRFWI